MMAKKRIVARRDWGFTLCQCLFAPIMMLLAIALLAGINFNRVLPPLPLLPEGALPYKYGNPVRAAHHAQLDGLAPRRARP